MNQINEIKYELGNEVKTVTVDGVNYGTIVEVEGAYRVLNVDGVEVLRVFGVREVYYSPDGNNEDELSMLDGIRF